MKQVKYCYGYVRVSTSMQVAEGHSLDDQTDRITAWAKLSGHKLIKIFIDAGVSGTFMFERPEFAKLINVICPGEVIVVCDMSRLSRNADDMLALVTKLKAKGATTVFIKENIDITTKAGKMVAGMMSMIREMEADSTSERVKEVCAANKERGQNMTRPAYGWKKSDVIKGSSLIEVPEEQAVIARIKQMYAEGISQTEIAKILTSEKIPPPGAKCMLENVPKAKFGAWNQPTIRNILNRKNVAVKGRYDP